MTELNWTEVDGVATVWADCPTPLRAGLLFRTGRADETLATSGWTHLIEHLALPAVGDSASRDNGFVTATTTGFVTMGSPDSVSASLAGVCRALGALPGDRLANEKQVLAAESAGRPYDVCANLLTSRLGAMGYGLMGMSELGQRVAQLEQLQEYATRRFTRENAVLWLSGPPPAGLSLVLPSAERWLLPPLSAVQKTFPSWFVDDACGGIAAGAVVPREPASAVYCEIVAARLRERMRAEEAVSYAPTVFYDPLSADCAHLVMYADSDPKRRAELAVAFGEVFEDLVQFEDSEVATAKARISERMSGPLSAPPDERGALEAQRAGMDWILDRAPERLEALESQAMSVSAHDLVEFNREVRDSVMFAMPSAAIIRPWIGAKAQASTVPFVQGREIPNVDAPIQRERLIHGPDGLTVWRPDGSHCTVRYAELAAAIRFDDGCVCLVGRDSATVAVEPTLWRNGQDVCREVRERVPADLLLDHGSRPADRIPRPATTLVQRVRSSLSLREPIGMGTLLIALAGLGLVGLVYGLAPMMSSTATTNASVSDAGPAALGFLLGSGLVVLLGGTGAHLLVAVRKRNASEEALRILAQDDSTSRSDTDVVRWTQAQPVEQRNRADGDR